jgi:hypothetical protein
MKDKNCRRLDDDGNKKNKIINAGRAWCHAVDVVQEEVYVINVELAFVTTANIAIDTNQPNPRVSQFD